jgi:hypothetical protein
MPQQADFLAWWYYNAAFHQNRVVARLRQASAATSLPSSAGITTIGFDTVDEDPYGGWNSGTHLWQPPAGYSGWYQVTLTVRIVSPAALVDLRPALVGSATYNLTTVESQSGAGGGASATFAVYLTGGQDTVGGAAQLINSGAAVNTSLVAGQQSGMEIVYLASQP